jgi:uncharacterized protein (DUF2141 family)
MSNPQPPKCRRAFPTETSPRARSKPMPHDSEPRSAAALARSGTLTRRGRLATGVVLAAACATAAHAEPVAFTVQNVGPVPARLVIALFRPTSAEWEKRFKRSENADAMCSAAITGKQTTETVACALAPSEYIGIAFVDTDGNGNLTHGVLGPTEQFGLTGVEESIKFPPEFKRTVIDTRRASRFVIVLN